MARRMILIPIHLSYFPFIDELRDEYLQWRKSGKTREETVNGMCKRYWNEVNDPDDGPLFWIAIGKAQCHYKEVTEDVAIKAKEGLDHLMATDINLSQRDADILCKKLFSDEFRQPPKVRKNIPPKKYCSWNVGDVYAMPMRGPEAKAAYLDDTYLLIRVSHYKTIQGKEYPSVFQMIWLDEEMPITVEKLNKSGYLVLHNYGSLLSKQPVFEEYLWFRSKNEFQQFSEKLTYVGNFPDAPRPRTCNDMCCYFVWPEEIVKNACYAFHNNGIEYLNV